MRPAPRRASPENVDASLLADVARRYFVRDESKVSIAADLGISRFQVARLLKEARDRHIVSIAIAAEGLLDPGLGERLCEHLGLRRAVVIASVPDQTNAVVLRLLGKALADLLREEVVEGESLGLTWSRVTASMVDQLSSIERCTVVQLAGHLLVEGETSSGIELVRRTAALGGGEAFPIYAPMIVDDAGTAGTLRRSPEVAHALDRAAHLDRSVVSIGAWGSSRSRVFTRLSDQEKRRGFELGAVGEFCGHVYDGDARLVEGLIDDRVIASPLHQVTATPRIVASSWGAETAPAVRTAARAGWLDTLITDEPLARAVLATP